MSNDHVLITTPITPQIVTGAVELEPTETGLVLHRLPAWARAQNVDAQLAMAEAQPSGVRLHFRTSSTRIELDTLPTKRDYIGMPARPDGIYDLRIDGVLHRQATAHGGKTLRVNMATGAATLEPGTTQTLTFDGFPPDDKTIEIWLPHNETTELVALRSDAPLVPIQHANQRKWLHYGSSISQGSNAASPTGIWPVVAATAANVNLLNLGFGGSAVLDPFVARTIRDTPADLISLKIGINLVNLDAMRLRAFVPAMHGFLDTIRDGHPTTPLLVISPIFCPIHETTPGPSMPDTAALQEGRMAFLAAGSADEAARGKLTLSVIRDQLSRIVAARSVQDSNLHYLDGTALYGPADADLLPLPDCLHPGPEAQKLIGERFAKLVFRTGAFSENDTI